MFFRIFFYFRRNHGLIKALSSLTNVEGENEHRVGRATNALVSTVLWSLIWSRSIYNRIMSSSSGVEVSSVVMCDPFHLFCSCFLSHYNVSSPFFLPSSLLPFHPLSPLSLSPSLLLSLPLPLTQSHDVSLFCITRLHQMNYLHNTRHYLIGIWN